MDGNYVTGNSSGASIGGIYVYNGSTTNVTIQNNVVVGNIGDGIRSGYNAAAKVINNTVVSNSGYGLRTRVNSNPTDTSSIRGLNNLVWGNTLGGITGNVAASYTLVQGGYTGTGNLSANPDLEPHSGKYYLRSESPARNAGVLSATVGGVILPAPTTDYNGYTRDTNPDIGAHEFNVLNSAYSWIDVPSTLTLSQNYPNPFNPATVISYQLSVFSRVSLRIYDILGREVATLVNGEQPPGVYKVEWKAAISSGVYFYRLEAVGRDGRAFVETKRMTLVR